VRADESDGEKERLVLERRERGEGVLGDLEAA
jgi:hypothetical protein